MYKRITIGDCTYFGVDNKKAVADFIIKRLENGYASTDDLNTLKTILKEMHIEIEVKKSVLQKMDKKKKMWDMEDYKGIIEIFHQRNQWVSAQNEIHNIDEMSTSHIMNCIKKIKREQWRLEYLPLFEKVVQERKEVLTKEINLLFSV